MADDQRFADRKPYRAPFLRECDQRVAEGVLAVIAQIAVIKGRPNPDPSPPKSAA